jgi:hypothetical protein
MKKLFVVGEEEQLTRRRARAVPIPRRGTRHTGGLHGAERTEHVSGLRPIFFFLLRSAAVVGTVCAYLSRA